MEQPLSNSLAVILADGNGNITYLVNSNRTLAASYRYDPFGNLISKSGPYSDANVYRFSSKELHVNSGLYYYLYRFYSPNWQRWINRDPINERGFDLLSYPRSARVSFYGHEYSFIKNSSINLIDPLGLIQWGKKCKQTDIEALKKQLGNLCKKAKDGDCFNKCKFNKEGTKGMEDACGSEDGKGPEVECEDASNGRCVATAQGTPCGWTDPRGKKTIHLCMNAPASDCPGGAGCTLFHELGHRVGGVGSDGPFTPSPDDRAYELEKCVGCRK